MKSIAIVGGNLQGIEACYLAQEADIEVVLIDKNINAPASKLCSKFICADILAADEALIKLIKEQDMLLPTLENDEVLEFLVELSSVYEIKLAFDINAYRISSSKSRSDVLFAKLGVPAPQYYPNGTAPYILKPNNQSGSSGVKLLSTLETEMVEGNFQDKGYIIQEYLTGPSYSIEVIGMPGMYRTYEVTKIHIDEDFDCCCVTSPCEELSCEIKEQMSMYIIKIAEALQLKGIMDLEVIYHNDELKALEIDARLPSQTPATVYRATGINMLEELYDVFCYGRFHYDEICKRTKYANYEHFFVQNNQPVHMGEHIMVDGNRQLCRHDLGDDNTIITDYVLGTNEYRATVITAADSSLQLEDKRKVVMEWLKSIR